MQLKLLNTNEHLGTVGEKSASSCLQFGENKVAVDGFEDLPSTSPSCTSTVSTPFSTLYQEIEECDQANEEFKKVKVNRWSKNKRKYKHEMINLNSVPDKVDKKINHLKRASQEITMFNRFSALIVENEEFKIPSSGSSISEDDMKNLQGSPPPVFNGKKKLKFEVSDYDVFGRKKGMGKMKSSHLKTLHGMYVESPYSILHIKKQNGRYDQCLKIGESISLKAFQHENRYSLLEDNKEEDLDNLKKRLSEIQLIKKIKRSELKKCHSCNNKKRTCLLDRSSCHALDQRCNFCNKLGHFPRSLNCKKFRQTKRPKEKHRLNSVNRNGRKMNSNKISIYGKICPDMLNEINTRISQLEVTELPTRNINCRQQEDFKNLIPFLMMYIFSTMTALIKILMVN